MEAPRATYRLQLHAGFGFAQARSIVPYLDRLGVSHLYLSPVTAARPGSTHGYDVTDPTIVNPELGGEDRFAELCTDVHASGMGVVLDIVPNHMSASAQNPWWRDVLHRGRRSPHARVFDIDWEAGRGKVVTPAAGRAPNYRRFFDVDDLVCVRVEDPEVFDRTHVLWLRLVRDGLVDGLRIDHIDGLSDPLGYLRRLRTEIGDTPIWVEKILARDEALPRDWPVDGTTGYEFADMVGGLFVHPGHLRLPRRIVGDGDTSFEAVVVEAKRDVLGRLFGAELESLGRRFGGRIEALREVTAHLDVYRTYARGPEHDPADRRRIRAALRRATPRAEDLGPLLLLDAPGHVEAVMRWQQLSGPAAAKGFEDTALYRYVHLTSRNEVGGNPGRPAVTPDEVHAFLRTRRRRWPRTLNATSTHDSKRSEDARARIDVLSELADPWRGQLERWERWNRPHVRRMDGHEAPDAAERLLFYQAAIGIWGEPRAVERLRAYMRKAIREAKVHTWWRDPVPEHEGAVDRFVRRVLAPSNEPFRSDLEAFARTVAHHGATNALAQLVVKLAAPGVADLYQGSELWHLALVDPDNRHPVDFRPAIKALDADDDPAALLGSWTDGRIKLHVTRRGLEARRARPDLFAEGACLPLTCSGPHGDRVFAFARRRRGRWAVAVVPRLAAGLATPPDFPTGDLWGTTSIALPPHAPAMWVDILTGEEVTARRGRLRTAAVLRTLPVALLLEQEVKR